MSEVRFHGRGGQGAVLASKILAKALVDEGKYVAAIPSFGFERRGAPVACFLRYQDKEIRSVTNIYNPDYVICIDPTVSKAVDIYAGMKQNGTLVQATKRPVEELDLPERVGTVGLCDAIGIGMEIFNKQITNSIMLGSFARTSGVVSLDALKKGLASANFRDAGLEQNLEAIERGYNETVIWKKDGEAWV